MIALRRGGVESRALALGTTEGISATWIAVGTRSVSVSGRCQHRRRRADLAEMFFEERAKRICIRMESGSRPVHVWARTAAKPGSCFRFPPGGRRLLVGSANAQALYRLASEAATHSIR